MPAMTDTQRFLFDLQGFLVLEDALTPDEVTTYRDAVYRLAHLKADAPAKWDERGEPCEVIRVHRPIEKEARFLDLADHPAVFPILQELVGGNPLLIDNDAELSPRHSNRNAWHRGVPTHGYHAENGVIFCTMVKCIWYLTDVRRGENATRLLPGSHKAKFRLPEETGADDLPGQRELEVRAGTVLIFSEAVLHAGNTNPSDRVRCNLYFNYGPSWVQPWEGYRPSERLVQEAGEVRRQLLGGGKIYADTEADARRMYE